MPDKSMNPGDEPTAEIGGRIRAQRERLGMSMRALAREIGISPSAMSQIEIGQSRPSVNTLYLITNELGMSLDALFSESGGETSQVISPVPTDDDAASSSVPVQRRADRPVIELESGVRWERLTAEHDPEVDFVYSVYEVGGASSKDRMFSRSGGSQYGLLLEGRLKVTMGFEAYELEEGDSISFDSSIPHLLENVGDGPAKAVWFLTGQRETSDAQGSAQAQPAARSD